MSTTMSGPVDPDELRRLPTAECALILLRRLAKGTAINSNNTFRGAEQAFGHNGEPDTPRLLERLADAWAWLESKALIGPDPTQTSGSWRRLTERGREVAADPNALTALDAEDRLVLNLHPLLEAKVRAMFALGDHETSAIGAFKNPASHRTVDYADPNEAVEVVLLADLLMRLLDRIEQRSS